MKKILIAGMIVLATTATSFAQHRHHFGARHSHHHGHRHGISPWVAGAVGLGILGAGIAAGSYYYNRVCWREHVGYDAWGRYVYRRVCE